LQWKARQASGVETAWPQLADQLKKDAQGPFAVCYEASRGYGFLYEEFSKVARQVTAAHPGSLRLIYKTKRKSNRVDAGKLANSFCNHL
jgi:hypothetical protein